MSFSDPVKNNENPASMFIEYKGQKGVFKYFDKSKADKENGIKGEDVIIPRPFEIVVIDLLSCVSGFNKQRGPKGCGLYSNEVHFLSKEALTVKFQDNNEEIVEGLHKDIKDAYKSKGGKFTKSIYGIYNGQLVNIKLAGSGFNGWVGFLDKNGITPKTEREKVERARIRFTDEMVEGEGTGTFYIPQIEFVDPPIDDSDTDFQVAWDADVALKEHFKEKKSTPERELEREDHDWLTAAEEAAEEAKDESADEDKIPMSHTNDWKFSRRQEGMDALHHLSQKPELFRKEVITVLSLVNNGEVTPDLSKYSKDMFTAMDEMGYTFRSMLREELATLDDQDKVMNYVSKYSCYANEETAKGCLQDIKGVISEIEIGF